MNFYNMVDQNRFILTIVLIFLCVFLILYIIRVKKRQNNIHFEEIEVPANIWFYSVLVNMQIGIEKPSYQRLHDCFSNYLYKRYSINKQEIQKSNIYDLIRSKEEKEDMLELYGEIWNSIEDLKDKETAEIIDYIKTIKFYFNKDGMVAWMSARKYNKETNCNNC